MELTSKFLYFSLSSIIVFLSCARMTQSVSHDTNIGFCQDVMWDRTVPLMTKVVHKRNNRIFASVRKIELELRFPENGEFPAPIKCIMAKDNDRNGDGAFVSVKTGGAGSRSVVLYFRSQRGGNISFNVGIFGYGNSNNNAPRPMYPAHQPGWNPQPARVPQLPPQPPQHSSHYGWNYPQPNRTYYGR